MASYTNIPRFTATLLLIFLIIFIASQQVESRGGGRGGGGSRGGSTRGGSRISSSRISRIRMSRTSRVLPSTRFIRTSRIIRVLPSTRRFKPATTRIRTRVRVGSNLLAWQTGIVAGNYYGSRAYMRRRRWFNHQEPRYCTNYYKTDSNDTVYGSFICPMEWQDDDMEYCCGTYGRQYCCDRYSRTSDNPHGNANSKPADQNYIGHTSYRYYKEEKLSGGQIAGIVIGVIIAVVILALLVYFCCLRNRGSTKGTVMNRMMKNQGKKDVKMQPVPLSDPAPLPATKYMTQPQDTIVHPTTGNTGMYQGNATYGMQPEFIPSVPPGHAPMGPPPNYDMSAAGGQPYGNPYPPPGEGPYPSGPAPYTVSNGQSYPPGPQ